MRIDGGAFLSQGEAWMPGAMGSPGNRESDRCLVALAVFKTAVVPLRAGEVGSIPALSEFVWLFPTHHARRCCNTEIASGGRARNSDPTRAMSEPAIPRSIRHRAPVIGAVSDGSAAASPRQVARLRFLGVSYREPLTIAQAGTLIDRTNADPVFAAKIEEWHVRKFELYPALYPPVNAAIVIPKQLMGGMEFKLPPRGEGEANATIFQKRRLEVFSGCDFPVIDSLGRDQAGALLAFLEAQAVARSLESIQADAAVRLQEAGRAQAASAKQAPVRASVPARPRRSRPGRWLLLGSIGAVAVAAYLNFGTMKLWVAAFAGNEAAVSPTDAANQFQQAVAASQSRAVKKYPALGVANSPFNQAFIASYQQLRRQQSARLNAPDWPEKLADECAAQISAGKH